MPLRINSLPFLISVLWLLGVWYLEPVTASDCYTLDTAIQQSRKCGCDKPLIQYFEAWETTNSTTDWQSTANQFRITKSIAEEHVRNGTGKQSEVDLVTIEVSLASTSEAKAEGSRELAVSTLLRSCGSSFECVAFPDGDPSPLNHSLPELQSLAVEADANVKSLRRRIATIERQIRCVRQEIAKKCDCILHRKRCAELRKRLCALQHQLNACVEQLARTIDAIQEKVELLYNDFTRQLAAMAELGAVHPSLTEQLVATNNQKYREGSGTIDSAIDGIRRMQRAQEQAGSLRLRQWRNYADLSVLIAGTP